jgi:hypothetical protein
MINMYDVIVIGAGAAGMMAAVAAGRLGARTCLLEQNEKPGKKIYITGKGRCNLTNACETEELFTHVVTNPKFLYSSFYSMTNWDVIDFFEKSGVRTKVERGERVFPASDKSSDIIRALWNECRGSGVDIRFHSRVSGLLKQEDTIKGVKLSDGTEIKAAAVIAACGGMSYASTGSDGEGFKLAKQMGHQIRPCIQGLVPMNLREDEPGQMQGLSLKNVELCFYTMEDGKKKERYREFGEMMFTHFGITGPIVLSASSRIGELVGTQTVYVQLDCKPALSQEKLHRRIVRDFEANPNVSFQNALGGLLPKSLIPVVIHRTGTDGRKPVNQITRDERESLVRQVKGLTFTVDSLRGWNEAIITRGGVSVREVNPSTMESRLINHLYFAGEMLDIDALTGGFNLQIAWSTGYLAGVSAAAQHCL